MGRVTQNTMSLIKKGRRSCRALARALARVWKFLLRHLTQQGELERAIRRALADKRGGHSPSLVKAIASSLARSSQLAEIKAAVFGKRPFSASVASAKIIAEKGIRDEKVGATLTWSLHVSLENQFVSTICCLPHNATISGVVVFVQAQLRPLVRTCML